MGNAVPLVSRRIQVRSDTKLPLLHRTIQCVMGWWGQHLHEFIVGEKRYGVPDPYDDLYRVRNQKGVPLTRLAEKKSDKFLYLYDFGDMCWHELVVEDTLPADPEQFYRVCLDSEWACPLEDVGGVGGYGEFLEAIADPGNVMYERYLEWIGGEWDMEKYKLWLVNLKLRLLRYGPRAPFPDVEPAD